MSYAEGTSVPVDRSQGEIRKILGKYGATGFAFGENGPRAMVAFEMSGRRIRFDLPLPQHQVTRDKKGYFMSEKQVDAETRRRWRCLVLAIKSKLECVESGISTFEEEFLAYVVLPNGRTMGQVAIPQIARSYENNEMPPLLGYDG